MAPPGARRHQRSRRPPPAHSSRTAAIEGEKKRLTQAVAVAPEVVRSPADPRSIRAAVKPLAMTKGKSFKIGPNKSILARFINIFLYGPYGHGKTTFVTSADDVPTMRDVLFINTDSGTMSVTSRRTMDFVHVTHYDQMARVFEFAVLHCYYRDQNPMNKEKMLELEKELKSEVVEVSEQVTVDFHGKEVGTDPERTWFVEQRLRSGKPMDEPYVYRTFILDSISELHKLLVYKFTGVDIGTHPLDEEIEKMEEWQPAQELFRLLIRAFRDLPANILIVSAEEIAGKGESDRKKGRRAGQAYPKLAGAVAADIAGFLDIVGYLVREDPTEKEGATHRYLYLGAGYEGWISKHRFENLPDLEYLEDPTLSKLLDLARKDDELHGTSATRGQGSIRGTLPTTSNSSSKPAAANSSRPTVSTHRRRRA